MPVTASDSSWPKNQNLALKENWQSIHITRHPANSCLKKKSRISCIFLSLTSTTMHPLTLAWLTASWHKTCQLSEESRGHHDQHRIKGPHSFFECSSERHQLNIFSTTSIIMEASANDIWALLKNTQRNTISQTKRNLLKLFNSVN